jgi:hypothetical protein
MTTEPTLSAVSSTEDTHEALPERATHLVQTGETA